MPIVTVVNDSPEFLELIGEVLEHHRCEVCTLAGDLDVQELVVTRPDLLIVDVRTGGPGQMAGWGLVVEARQRPELHAVPVIICTGDLRFIQEHDAEIRALDATVLAKPFAVDELERAVAHVLTAAPPDSSVQPEDGSG